VQEYKYICIYSVPTRYTINTRVGPKLSGLTYKSQAKWKMLRGIYSAIYGEVNVSVSGGYVLQYAGGTRASSPFISVTLKSRSCRKLLDPIFNKHKGFSHFATRIIQRPCNFTSSSSSILSDDRSKASSKTMPPHSAI